MIVDQEPTAMRAEVAPVLADWKEAVVPGRVELLPHNRYSPRYAWMFSFEKRLKYRIEEVLGHPLGKVERELFGADGVLSEALSNAFVHGHGRDPLRAIQVRCVVGRGGLLFSVRDQGPGFDVVDHVERLRRGSARFHIAGNGLRAFHTSRTARVSFMEGGCCVHILVPFLAREDQVPP